MSTKIQTSTEFHLPPVEPTRNYTSNEEKDAWWYIKRWSKDNKSLWPPIAQFPFRINKQEFRERRSNSFYWKSVNSMRLNYQNNNEIGAFLKLTNAFAIVPDDTELQNFYNTVLGDLNDLPVLNVTLCGCKIVGRMCVGNKNGLLVPDGVYDSELSNLRNELPESVKLVKIEERLSALGNIACNDNMALIHPEVSKENEEVIADTLGVEVFRTMIGNNPLVGSYCVLNNNGGMVHPEVSQSDLESLSSLLQLSLSTGTINQGCNVLGSGLAVNDFIAYAGMKTTGNEFSVINSAFQLKNRRS